MDDKYTGCNIVESVVTTATPARRSVKKERGGGFNVSHLFLRIAISALIIGAILILHYYPSLPYAQAVSAALKKVFCYDVYGRTAFGIPLIG